MPRLTKRAKNLRMCANSLESVQKVRKYAKSWASLKEFLQVSKKLKIMINVE